MQTQSQRLNEILDIALEKAAAGKLERRDAQAISLISGKRLQSVRTELVNAIGVAGHPNMKALEFYTTQANPLRVDSGTAKPPRRPASKPTTPFHETKYVRKVNELDRTRVLNVLKGIKHEVTAQPASEIAIISGLPKGTVSSLLSQIITTELHVHRKAKTPGFPRMGFVYWYDEIKTNPQYGLPIQK